MANAADYQLTSFERACCAYRRLGTAVRMVLVLALSCALFAWAFGATTLEHVASDVAAVVFISVMVSAVGAVTVSRKYARAADAENATESRRLGRFLHGDPTQRNLLGRFTEGHALLIERKYDDARAIFAELDRRKRLRPWFRRSVMNNLAFATSMAGDPAKGIELARAAVAYAKRHPPRRQIDLDIYFGTLGVALSLGGEHQEAVDYLAQVTAREGWASHQAVRGYFLGTSLLALRRNDEALVAFDNASKQGGFWAKRAGAAHAEAIARPHRT